MIFSVELWRVIFPLHFFSVWFCMLQIAIMQQDRGDWVLWNTNIYIFVMFQQLRSCRRSEARPTQQSSDRSNRALASVGFLAPESHRHANIMPMFCCTSPEEVLMTLFPKLSTPLWLTLFRRRKTQYSRRAITFPLKVFVMNLHSISSLKD